ncbi:Gfo/Idh/MocA family protein [Streptococcus sp. H49]|uniref:Gfo/Idh/MocA family protein n=1 Tax=Streptococcus huangxiaojuni TaxID=3237239 RepID=UPI0034A13BE1
MRLTIVGSGMIVSDFLSIIADLPELQLESLVGTKRSWETLQAMKAEYGFRYCYTDAEEAFAKDSSDTVYIAVPNHLHYRFSKLALEAGKNVICEKPFTLKADELRHLKVLAEEKGLILLEAITNQYLGNYAYIKEMLPTLGDLKLVECNYSQYSSRYDAFKQGTVLPAFDREKGGGALMDINIYNIHFVVGLLGKPTAVHYYPNIERGIDTSGILILDYDGTKAVCIGAKDSESEIRTTLQGNKGALVVNGATNTLPSLTLSYHKSSPQEKNNNHHPHRMYSEFKQFIKVIAEGDLTFAREQLEHSLIVMEVLEEARNSMAVMKEN